MSQNITTSDLICPDLDWYIQVGHKADYVIYTILSPLYFVLVLFGHGLCLKAFHTKSKQDSAYMYQIFTTVSETLLVLGWGMYVGIFKLLAGFKGPGQIWYKSCYSCMEFAAGMGPTPLTTCVTMSQLFTICMSADRVYSLWKPASYRGANHTRNHILTVTFCVTLAILASAYNSFLYSVGIAKNGTSEDPPLYQIVYTPSKLDFIQALNWLHKFILAFGLIAFFFLNAALLYFYHIRIVKAAQVLNLTNEQKKREEAEKSLLLLTLCQCFWTACSVAQYVSFLVIVVFFPVFFMCKGPLYVPIMDAFLQFVDTADLVSVILISKHFRRMIQDELRCCTGSNAVGSLLMPQGAPNVIRHQ